MVCDRIVKLVLATWVWSLKKTAGKGKWRRREVREGDRSTDMREWVLGFGCEVDVGR